MVSNYYVFFGIFLVSMLFVPASISPTTAQDSEIPAWIKNNAGWWATDQIDDSSFLQGIQYLIKEGIMVIPPTETSESSGSDGIPTWIKNNAGWWADGQIHDDAFVSGIQWLISNGIMVVEQEESVPSGPGNEIVYQTKVVSSKTPHTVGLIYSTQNDTCSANEKEKAKAYGIMAEYLVSKTPRSDPTQVTAYCIQLHEITGGTFTVTNVGSFGSIMGTPIINQPQVAILALGKIQKKATVIETDYGDSIGIRSKMFLSLSYDHRVVDGALSGQFLKRIADYLEAFDQNREMI